MRKVAGLAAVAAVLAGYLLFGDRGSGANDGASGRHVRLVKAFNRAAVRRMTISRAGAAPFSLARQPPDKDPAWRESPGGEAADAAAVEDLLDAIDLAETRRTAEVDASAAGLTPPRVALELEQPRGPVRIDLGRLDAAGQGVFARVGGAATIRVAPRRLAELADRDPSAFRDRRLVPLSAESVAALGWRAGGRGPAVARSTTCVSSPAAGRMGKISQSPRNGWRRACGVSSGCASIATSPLDPGRRRRHGSQSGRPVA